jgi:hypothetical protein
MIEEKTIECYEIRFNYVVTTGECDSYTVNEHGVISIDEQDGAAQVEFHNGDVEFIYNVHHSLYRESK